MTASVDLLQGMIDALDVPVFIKDEAQCWVLVNEAVCRLTGRTREGLTGLGDHQLFPSEQADAFRDATARVLETGETDVREEPISWNGESQAVSTRRSLFVEPESGRRYVIAVLRDLGDDQRAARGLDALVESALGNLGDEFFANLCNWLEADCAAVSELLADGQAKVLSMHLDGKTVKGGYFPVSGTPCGNVVTDGFCAYPNGVRELFPDAAMLAQLEAEGYVGTPLRGKDGQPVGVLCVISRRPLNLPSRAREVMHVLAARAGAEIERRRAEALLVRERDRAQHYLHIAANILLALDADGNVSMVNRKGLDVLGCGEQEVVGKNWFATFLPPRIRKEVRSVFAQIMAGDVQSAEFYEAPVLTASGEERLVAWHNSLLRDERGQVTGTLSSGEDITERRRFEQALLDSEERLKILFDNAPDACYLIDSKGVFIDGNRAAEEMIGYARRELIGSMFFKTGLLSALQIPKAMKLLARNVLGLPTGPDEFTLNRKDGSRVTAEIRTYPVKIKACTLILGIARDVTERRAAEEAVRRSEERYRRLFEQASDAVFMHTLQGEIVDVNQRACDLLRCSRQELLSANIAQLHPEESLGQSRRAMAAAGEQGAVRFETRFRRWDGGSVDVDINARVIDKERGLVQGVARDITERKRLQEEQRQYAERLEAEVLERTDEIRQSQARYRALFEDVDHAIFTTDRDGRVTSCNRAAEAMVDRSEETVVGNLICLAMCGKESCSSLTGVLEALKTAGTVTHECTAVRDGQHRPIHCAVSVVRGADNAIQGHTWVATDLSEQERLEEEARRAHDYAKTLLRHSGLRGEMIGSGRAWQDVARFVADAAQVPSPVLVLGESGTGKEVASRAIHTNSSRDERPFVILDCAALKGELLESELFGHEMGAFTGASQSRAGLAEVADGGTLFVDEIGEMPLGSQAKLLRVLEKGEFRRVGATDTRQVDIRVVAATNRDLAVEVENGRFREDLYYRLNVLSITLPPLRDRREDIPLLAQHFLENGRVTVSIRKQLHRSTVRRLQAYDWPGNVRELANVLERAVILSGDQPVIMPVHLPPEIRAAKRAPARSGPLKSLEGAEREAIAAALNAMSGNRTHAARVLKTSLVTLRRKIKKYSIK